MNLKEFLPENAVLPELTALSETAVLSELIEPLLALHPELNGAEVLAILQEREALGSTAVGDGVAIPHGKIDGLGRLALAVGRSVGGIEFKAPDKEPVHLFFLILAPENEPGSHLRLLAQIARRVKDPLFRADAMNAQGRSQLWQTITEP
ncbi:PTS sugar transporter subunit IIA [Desulfovibrio sp. OttesenSCG-928-A18]|nr:PTS sugar transporter subunit IIA [Desulfovibrio sp. OttesenSCG-928-A18]